MQAKAIDYDAVKGGTIRSERLRCTLREVFEAVSAELGPGEEELLVPVVESILANRQPGKSARR